MATSGTSLIVVGSYSTTNPEIMLVFPSSLNSPPPQLMPNRLTHRTAFIFSPSKECSGFAPGAAKSTTAIDG